MVLPPRLRTRTRGAVTRRLLGSGIAEAVRFARTEPAGERYRCDHRGRPFHTMPLSPRSRTGIWDEIGVIASSQRPPLASAATSPGRPGFGGGIEQIHQAISDVV